MKKNMNVFIILIALCCGYIFTTKTEVASKRLEIRMAEQNIDKVQQKIDETLGRVTKVQQAGKELRLLANGNGSNAEKIRELLNEATQLIKRAKTFTATAEELMKEAERLE